jgi:hypothetical protein
MAIYPALGNHDLFPLNIYDFTAAGINQEVEDYKSSWESFLDADAI